MKLMRKLFFFWGQTHTAGEGGKPKESRTHDSPFAGSHSIQLTTAPLTQRGSCQLAYLHLYLILVSILHFILLYYEFMIYRAFVLYIWFNINMYEKFVIQYSSIKMSLIGMH